MIPSSILWVFCRCIDTGIHIKFEKELEFFESHITALSEVLKGNFFLYRSNNFAITFIMSCYGLICGKMEVAATEFL